MPDFKRAIWILVIIILFSFISAISFAESPLDTAQANYSRQFTNYRDSYEDYIRAKATYKTYKTAAAKNDTFNKTKIYLNEIDKLHISYLELVREYTNSVNWGNDDKNKIAANQLLTEDNSFFNKHQQKVATSQTLEDLPILSEELNNHINNETIFKINKIIAQLQITQTQAFLNEFISISAEIENYAILKNPDKSSLFANWKTEIKKLEDEGSISLNKAKEELSKSPETTTQDQVRKISSLSEETKGTLLKSKLLFSEILRSP